MELEASAQQALSTLAGVETLAAVRWDELPEAELPAAAAALARAKAVIEGALVAVAHELEVTDAAAVQGWASAKDFLTAQLGGYKGAGAGYVRLGAQAHPIPPLREAIASGALSLSQARVITTCLGKLPRTDEALRHAVTEAMVSRAQTYDASDLERQFDDVLAEIDPEDKLHAFDRELPLRERGAHLSRHLSFSADRFGGVKIKGYASAEEAELVKSALLPLAAPVTTEPGACGGDRSLPWGRDEQGVRVPEAGCPDPACAHDGRDPRDSGARLWDALVEACARLQATDSLPHSHGTATRLFVTMDLATLQQQVADSGRPGTGTMSDGVPLSVAAVRRLACDAEIIPGVLGSNGQVLDLGRAQRLVGTAIWLALVLRDRHCAFPGCTRLPIACDAHHIVHWADGGVTSLDNLVLLCRRHHSLTHQSTWAVSIDPDTGKPRWRPPPAIDDRDRFSWVRPKGAPPGRPLWPPEAA